MTDALRSADSARPWWRRQHVATGALFAIWLWWALPGLLAPGSQYLDDTFWMDIPRRLYAARLLRQGEIPHWTPDLMCGLPFLAEGADGLCYPPTLLYLLWPSPKANDLFVALHVLWGAYGMYLFARGHTGEPLAALLGSSLFAYDRVAELHWATPCIAASSAWLPWCLVMVDRAALGWRPARTWGAAAASMMLLTGGFDLTLVWWGLIGVYALWKRVAGPPRVRLLDVAWMFVLAIVLSGVQLAPLLEFFRTSNRAEADVLSAAREQALPLAALLPVSYLSQTAAARGVNTIAPLPLHLTAAAAAVVVGGWCLAAVYAWRRPVFWFWALLAAAGLASACDTPLFTLRYSLPVLSWFRHASYLFILASVVGVIAATIGYAELLRNAAAKGLQRPLRAATWAVLLLAAALGSHHWGHYVGKPGLFEQVDPRLAEIVDDARRRQAHFRAAPLEDAVAQFASSGDHSEASYRKWAAALPPNYNLLQRTAVAARFDQRETVSPRRILRLLELAHEQPLHVYPWCGVTHLVDLGPHPLVGAEPLQQEPVAILRLPHSPGRAWLVYDTVQIVAEDDQLAAMAANRYDPAQTALLETTVEALGPRPQRPPQVRCVQPSVNSLACEVETDAPGLLVVADCFAPHWQATIDGQRVPILQANYAFRAVRVPAGQHRVTMWYQPRSTRLGWLVSMLGALALLVDHQRFSRGRPWTVVLAQVCVLTAALAVAGLWLTHTRPREASIAFPPVADAAHPR